MHNLIILGSGRSGTSMVTALFRHSGAFFGDRLIPPSPANPYGYYEDFEINDLNAAVIQLLLAQVWQTERLVRGDHPIHRHFPALWLAAPWHIPPVSIPPTVRDAMLGKFRRQPFCFKDPRFCVTLPAWRPHLPADVRFLVVFRDPHRTVDSILRDAVESYDTPLPVTANWAYLHWWRNYRRLLDQLSTDGDWLFVHYDDVLSGRAVPAVEHFVDARVDTSQLDPRASRSKSRTGPSPFRHAAPCARLYERLRTRAAADLKRWTPEANDTLLVTLSRGRGASSHASMLGAPAEVAALR
jgi:hypothetical protein